MLYCVPFRIGRTENQFIWWLARKVGPESIPHTSRLMRPAAVIADKPVRHPTEIMLAKQVLNLAQICCSDRIVDTVPTFGLPGQRNSSRLL